MKKLALYAVTFEIAMNVVAEDEDGAVRIASRNVREEDPESYLAVSTMRDQVASGWPDSAIPYADERTNKVGSVGAWRALLTKSVERKADR